MAKVKPLLTIIDPVKPPGQTYAGPVMDAARERFEIRFLCRPTKTEALDAAEISEVIWVDWCVDVAATLSEWNANVRKPLYIRVHAFEVLEGSAAPAVTWQNVTAVICVSSDIARLLRTQVPGIDRATRVEVIPNGVCARQYKPSADFNPKHIAWVGVLAPKKNPFLALHVLHGLVQVDRQFRLSIAGAAENPRTVQHLHFLVERLGLRAHVEVDGHIHDMARWLGDKGVLLSTSLYESFGFAIAEAAAAGLRPVVFDFPNADAIWPPGMLVSTIGHAISAVRSARQNEFREWVCQTYPLERQVNAFRDQLLRTDFSVLSRSGKR